MIRPGKGSKQVVATVAVLAGLAAAPASAVASIQVGSDLSFAPGGTANACILSTPPCTMVLYDAHYGSAFPGVSPTAGSVTGFSIRSASADTVTFRLARLLKKNVAASGAGTGPTVTLPAAGTYSYPASLPISVGDRVGIDTSLTRAFQGLPCATGDRGHEFTYSPVLVNGGPFQPGDANSICELLVNATVEPSNRFKVGRAGKLRRGRALLPVKVPGPGKLKLKGNGVKSGKAKVKRAGKAKLSVRPTGGATGSLKVKITFSPTGGVPRTKKPKLKLKR